MEKLEKLYEGKAKQLYATDDPEVLWVEYKNSATAGDGEKKEDFAGKGRLNNLITTLIFDLLKKRGIDSHLVARVGETSQLVKKVTMFPLEIVLMLLMLLGSINFVLHSEMWKGHVEVFFRDLEIRTMVLWLAVMTCELAASLSASPEFSSLPAMLRRGLFMVISAFSTTGFQNITTNELTTALSSGAFFVLAILMAVGGSGGSTSGGLKFSRMGIIMKSIVATIKEALAPDSARVVVSYNHVGRRILSPEVVKEAMTVFVLYVATYAVGTLVGIAHGYEAPQAIFESVAMASNGGVSSGLAAPGMSPSLELFYIAQMWAGRLEFVTLLALVAEIIVSLNPKRRVLKS